jgi:uncharacterized protein YjbI with pentapeptide repeats
MIAAKTRCNARDIPRNYTGRRLGGRHLYHAALEGAILRDTVFGNVDVACLNLLGADLRGADLSQTRVGYCKPERGWLERAFYDERTKWPPHWAAFNPFEFGMIKR